MRKKSKRTHGSGNKMYLNRPQIMAMLIDPKIYVGIMGRGVGKSTHITSQYAINRTVQMPRASFGVVGESYEMIEEQTTGPMIAGWEQRGFVRGEDFVVGEKPPEGWDMPLTPPKKWKRTITWRNGTCFKFISLARPTSALSHSLDGLFVDEAKLINAGFFAKYVRPTNRGNNLVFGHCPHHHFLFMTSSMPDLPMGQWLLDYEEQVNEKQIELLIALGLKIEEYKGKYEKAETDKEKAHWQKKIEERTAQKLSASRNSVYFGNHSSLANVDVLGLQYFYDALGSAELTHQEFCTEYLNIPPRKVGKMFYGSLTDRNFYRIAKPALGEKYGNSSMADTDTAQDKGLDLGIDWGGFNCLVVGQEQGSDYMFLKNFHTGDGRIIDDLLTDFKEYYRYHRTRKVELWYDSTGNNRQANSRLTYAKQAKKVLEDERVFGRWQVTLKTTGQGSNVDHEDRMLLWALGCRGDRRLPVPRINEVNCHEFKTALELAPTVEVNGKTKKDKSSERKKSFPQHYATHFTDAGDALYYQKFRKRINGNLRPYLAKIS